MDSQEISVVGFIHRNFWFGFRVKILFEFFQEFSDVGFIHRNFLNLDSTMITPDAKCIFNFSQEYSDVGIIFRLMKLRSPS